MGDKNLTMLAFRMRNGLFRLFCHSFTVLDDLSWVTCPGCSVLGVLSPGVLPRMSCLGYPALDVLSQISCPGLSCLWFPVPGVLSQLSRPECPVSGFFPQLPCLNCLVMAFLSWMSCPDCFALFVLSWLPGCPFNAVLQCCAQCLLRYEKLSVKPYFYGGVVAHKRRIGSLEVHLTANQ
jgi:hypothetical protein